MIDPDVPDNSSIHPSPPRSDAGDAAGAGEQDRDLTGIPSYLRAFVEVSSPVNMATGIIMGIQDCSQRQARALLQNAADHRSLPVEAIATDIIASMNGSCSEDP